MSDFDFTHDEMVGQAMGVGAVTSTIFTSLSESIQTVVRLHQQQRLSAQQAIQQLASRVMDYGQKWEDQTAALSEQVANLESSLDTAEGDLHEYRITNDELNRRLADFRTQLEQSKEYCQTLEASKNEQLLELNALRAFRKSANARIVVRDNREKELQRRLDALEMVCAAEYPEALKKATLVTDLPPAYKEAMDTLVSATQEIVDECGSFISTVARANGWSMDQARTQTTEIRDFKDFPSDLKIDGLRDLEASRRLVGIAKSLLERKELIAEVEPRRITRFSSTVSDAETAINEETRLRNNCFSKLLEACINGCYLIRSQCTENRSMHEARMGVSMAAAKYDKACFDEPRLTKREFEENFNLQTKAALELIQAACSLRDVTADQEPIFSNDLDDLINTARTLLNRTCPHLAEDAQVPDPNEFFAAGMKT